MRKTRLHIVIWIGVGLLAAYILSAAILQSQYGLRWREAALRWQTPHYLWLLVAVVLGLCLHLFWNVVRRPHLKFSRVRTLAQIPKSWRRWFAEAPLGLAFAALVPMTLALGGPQSSYATEKREQSGIEIMLAMDMSGSMQAEDVQPDRFLATQAVVDQFIERRPNDRIGVVVFAVDAYNLMPLTTDHEALRNAIASLQLEEIDPAGTAIGNAIGTALNRLRRTDAKSKVIILLTDGDSNAGNLSPSEAADLAAKLGVKIFPVLMGVSENASRARKKGFFGQAIGQQGRFPINPELLKEIAHKTGGDFFGVSDRESLELSFHKILDRLEKSEIEDSGKVYADLYRALAGPALALLALSFAISIFVVRRWP